MNNTQSSAAQSNRSFVRATISSAVWALALVE
jgi:hypothetical protein